MSPASLRDVLPASTERIMAMLSDNDLVLDVGGWAAPFNRANWILDLMPYETRNVLMPAGHGPGEERFTAETWVQRDFCDRAILIGQIRIRKLNRISMLEFQLAVAPMMDWTDVAKSNVYSTTKG